jgi:hypothetical protein
MGVSKPSKVLVWLGEKIMNKNPEGCGGLSVLFRSLSFLHAIYKVMVGLYFFASLEVIMSM